MGEARRRGTKEERTKQAKLKNKVEILSFDKENLGISLKYMYSCDDFINLTVFPIVTDNGKDYSLIATFDKKDDLIVSKIGIKYLLKSIHSDVVNYVNSNQEIKDLSKSVNDYFKSKGGFSSYAKSLAKSCDNARYFIK